MRVGYRLRKGGTTLKSYFLSVAAAALIAAICSLLAPSGEGGGIAKHVKLLTSLLLVCVLIAPVGNLIEGLQGALSGEITFPWEENGRDTEEENLQDRLDEVSTAYFTELLTQSLEREFAIETGDLRCAIQWEGEGEQMRPARVTLLLSGKAVWKDPEAMEKFVTELLDCECVSAIE